MEADDILRRSEEGALDNSQIVSHVTGKSLKATKRGGKTIGASLFITAIIVVFLIIFGTNNLMPVAISERLVEETDVQYADAVESKKLVFEQALRNGDFPELSAKLLKDKGVLVGYVQDGEFIESTSHSGGLSLKMGDKIITPDKFLSEVSHNAELYEAFTIATYSRAAYYYDETAEKVIRRIGTSRNNFREYTDFDQTMDKVMGSGSNIQINGVEQEEKTRTNPNTGEKEIYYEYKEAGQVADSQSEAQVFIKETLDKSATTNIADSTINSATFLNTADTVAKEQRSSLYYLLFMENISMMKAGDGNRAKLNDAMNFLYEKKTTEMVDVKTGEIIEVSGTPIESPSLYAILAGGKVDAGEVENYASDRVITTIGNQAGNPSMLPSDEIVASTSTKTRGKLGRLMDGGIVAGYDSVATVEKTISDSLKDNSFQTLGGISAGEFLVEGAVNVGKALAKGSGASAGDAKAVIDYARLNQSVLAMDAKVDRMNRSPFDITSKNTFLGSLVYKFAISNLGNNNSLFSGIKKFSLATSSAILSLLPSTSADATETFLTSFGDCKTIPTVGAVGSLHCSEVATFDTSTLNDPFNDSSFMNFVEQNTELNSSGVRVIKRNSALSKYILYNNERITPIGVMDGGILEAVSSDSSIPFLSGFVRMVRLLLGASEEDKGYASGKVFVNSGANPDWQEYKYAQRYVSLARATAALRKSSGSSTAYNNIRFFEGTENPVVAFLADYYASK